MWKSIKIKMARTQAWKSGATYANLNIEYNSKLNILKSGLET